MLYWFSTRNTGVLQRTSSNEVFAIRFSVSAHRNGYFTVCLKEHQVFLFVYANFS